MTFEVWFNHIILQHPGAKDMREAFRQAYMLGYTHGWDDGESLQKDIDNAA